MNVLIGCEMSGVVREAFAKRGHNAWSCDLKPSLIPGNHFQQDIVEVLRASSYWDIIILHPDCTAMALSGNRHYGKGKPKYYLREIAIKWTRELWEIAKKKARIGVCAENPASVMFKNLGVKAQYIQPHQFGHTEQKKTGLALDGLPELQGTKDVYQEMMKLPKCKREKCFYMSPSLDRGEKRSITYQGIAEAMAEQWGGLAP